jgi:hypothetical protein
MVITHLPADDPVLVRLALMYNPYSNVVDISLRSENIRRSSLSYIPTPPNSRQLGQSGALAARTNKVDSHLREFLKFDFLNV